VELLAGRRHAGNWRLEEVTLDQHSYADQPRLASYLQLVEVTKWGAVSGVDCSCVDAGPFLRGQLITAVDNSGKSGNC
jgi:hypothetical protein